MMDEAVPMHLAVAFVLHALDPTDLLTLRRGLEIELADVGEDGELLLRVDANGQYAARPDALVAQLARRRGINIRLFETPASGGMGPGLEVRDDLLVGWADRVAIFRSDLVTPDIARLSRIARQHGVALSTWSVENGLLEHVSEAAPERIPSSIEDGSSSIREVERP